jgi:hypothetical protein
MKTLGKEPTFTATGKAWFAIPTWILTQNPGGSFGRIPWYSILDFGSTPPQHTVEYERMMNTGY